MTFMQVDARLKFLSLGLVIGLEHIERACKMCESVRQKLGHTITVHKISGNRYIFSSKKLWCGQLYVIDSHQILTLPTFNIDSKQGQTFCKRVAPNSEVVPKFF